MRLLILTIIIFCSCQPYKKLHRQAFVADTHNDVLSAASMKGMLLDADLTGRTHSDISRLQKGGVDAQIFAIFCDERFGKNTAFAFANREIDSLYAVISRNPQQLMMVRSASELESARQQKKLACLMGVEGGHMIEDKLAYLDSFYARGVSYLTLTWNNSTSWATSAKDETAMHHQPDKKSGGNMQQEASALLTARSFQTTDTASAKPKPKAGLTSFGKKIVQHMNRLGMMIDLSHAGEQTFWDVINTTTKPVLVSHSCAYSLCPVPRNLKDDQIKAVGENGGVIHVNFYLGFIDSSYEKRVRQFFINHAAEKDSLTQLKKPDYEIEEILMARHAAEAEALRPPIDILVNHIDRIVLLAGIDHVGLGSDFDGISSTPKELNDVTDLPLLTKALLQRGYSKKDIRKILGENFLRLFKANRPG